MFATIRKPWNSDTFVADQHSICYVAYSKVSVAVLQRPVSRGIANASSLPPYRPGNSRSNTTRLYMITSGEILPKRSLAGTRGMERFCPQWLTPTGDPRSVAATESRPSNALQVQIGGNN